MATADKRMIAAGIGKPPTAETSNGRLEGLWNRNVATFLGIPYGQPPVGRLRWAPPVRAASSDGTLSAVEAGPVPPQLPARLERAMGPMQAPDPDEDCLTLNVWTPVPSRTESLPVLVFIHGGGYLSGAGSAGWYEGRVMAARGPAVVVTINYRLGALGYMYLPPSMTSRDPVANLGLLDICLALEWVQSNASSLGGDPGNITIFGQSGGAHSIVALQGIPRSAGLFQRAILQSAPLFLSPVSAEDAGRNTRTFFEEAGVPDAGLAGLRSLAVQDIIAAQRATLARTARLGRLDPPFHLVLDGHVLSEDPIADGARGFRDDVDLLIGFTADEACAHFAFDDALWALEIDALVEKVREQRGEQAALTLQAYAARSPNEPAAAVFCKMVSDRNTIGPAVRLAERRAAAGKPAYLYRFSWRSDAAQGRLGACHTIELPFVFNNFDQWTQAPMLGRFDRQEVEELATVVQDAWLAFAASGNPSHSVLPKWGPYRASDQTMDFDISPRILHDPSDGRRVLWDA